MWYQDASFPNPAQQFTRGTSGTNYTKTCPAFEVTFDLRKGEYVRKGQTFDDVYLQRTGPASQSQLDQHA